MILLVPIFPFILMLLCLWLRSEVARGTIALLGTGLQLLLVAALWIRPPPTGGIWFALDPVGHLFLTLISIVFFAVVLYSASYLKRTSKINQSSLRPPVSPRIYTAAMFLMEAGLTLACVSQHLGMFFAGIEIALLAAAPLIYFRRNDKAAKATWKFLIVTSLAMAFLMIGGIFNRIAIPAEYALSIRVFITSPQHIRAEWFNIAAIFYTVGLGTLMAVAPMHAWLPETEEAAPSPFAPLLSCGLALVAFFGFFRIYALETVIGGVEFLLPVLIILGFVSVFTAAFFIVVQASYKRLVSCLAIGQFGILTFGLGLGDTMVEYVFLHLISYTFIMTALFLLCANINAATGTYLISETSDLYRRIPRTAILWIVATLAICGFPLFGLFITEFQLLRHCFENGRYFVASMFIIGRFFIFAAITYHVFRMVQPPENAPPPGRLIEPRISIWVPASLCLCAFIFGFYVPEYLREIIAGVVVWLKSGGGV